MSTTTINWKIDLNANPQDADSVVLEDPTASYGVIRKDTNGVVVPAGTVVPRIVTGEYEYSFTDPAEGLEYRYYIKAVIGGLTFYYERDYSLAESTVAPIVGRYSSQTCLYNKFGQENITRWATFADNETETTISQRIQNAIDYADNYVDDYLLGGPYMLPFVDPIPTTINDIACVVAGVQIYTARGIDDFDEAPNRLTTLMLEAVRQLGMIKSGRMELSDYVGDNYMKVYKEPNPEVYNRLCLDDPENPEARNQTLVN